MEKAEQEKLVQLQKMDLVREKRIKEEEEEREELNQIYKEKIAKIEQEKLVQTEAGIKLEEGEREIRPEESQEQERNNPACRGKR